MTDTQIPAAPGSSAVASILAAVDLADGAASRLDLVFDLADRLSSAVIGVAACRADLPFYFDGAIGLANSIASLERREAAEHIGEAEALFRRAAGTRTNIEWRAAASAPLKFFADQVRAADLVIVGGADRTEAPLLPMELDAGDEVMVAGRPLLVVPPGVSHLACRTVVIAWKDTREARRAVGDALPLLKLAGDVCVLAVGPGPDEAGANDVAGHLKRHGIPARVMVRPTPAHGAGQEILDVAKQWNADLIVAGAYGHSRLREWALGGVTRHLLLKSPVCCLISH